LNKEDIEELVDQEPVHNWFGLTYSSYLVLPRVLLQSAPLEWQQKFIRLLNDLEEMFPDQHGHEYWVRRKERDQNGRFRFIHDPLSQYRHNRVTPRLLTHKEESRADEENIHTTAT